MADFLTRLASRTLGLAPMAEPVIAPMFAPDSQEPFIAGSDEPLQASQVAEPVAPRLAAEPPSASPPESVARPVAGRSRPEPAEARLVQPSMGETLSRTITAAPDVAIVRDLPTRRRPQLPAAAASETVDENALLMPAAGAPKRQSPVGTSTPAATTLPARPDSPDSFLTSTPWTEDLVAPSGQSAVRQGRTAPSSWDVGPDEPLLLPLNRAEAPSMQRAAAATLTPVDEPEPPRRAERGQAAKVAMPSSPPTIEVTIGRVEVRAVHPPAPIARPKPVAPAAPRLSLEEYLRNQNGGRP